MEYNPVKCTDVEKEWIARMDAFAKEVVTAFQISPQMLGVLYEGQFIPTGPVVESKEDK